MESQTTLEAVTTEHDTTEAMNPSLLKRKAEMQSVEDSGDGESGGEGETEIEEGGGGGGGPSPSSTERYDDSKEWEWGYDSFEGREYEPRSEDEFSDEESNQKIRAYMKQYFEHKGFYIEAKNIPWGQIGGIFPYRDEVIDKVCPILGKTEREHMGDMAKQALQKYNDINGSNVTFECVKRVNVSMGSIVKYYVTILAKENPDTPQERSVENKTDLSFADQPTQTLRSIISTRLQVFASNV